MLGSDKPHLNPAEKIDAIYDMLRRAERHRRVTLGIRLAIVAVVIFGALSFASDPRAPGFAETMFERYMLPRLTDMAGRMAERMQADLMHPSSSSPDVDNVDTTGFADPAATGSRRPNTRTLAEQFPTMKRADIAEMMDMGMLDSTLESAGVTPEEFLAAFPE